ncbi:hypothetical protein [Pedobacter ureilyticus]|uniref:Erythromycin esterase family protein n=1 Tax=Pedobacter ureilyticus TaxID=1393051 RepID=A0ABW9JBZ0_9SPHI|nr:hypothetical protein [Pedobacter helvus]
MKNFLAAALLFLCISSKAQTLETYLTQNHSKFDGNFSKKLFDNSFYDSQFIFLGETHGFADPQQADLSLIKHLNKVNNLKYYIAEVDATKAWLLNNFFADGDEKWLKLVFRSWVSDTAQWANAEYKNKYRQIYEYQKSLSNDKKLTLIGIDAVQDWTIIPLYINHLTENNDVQIYKNHLIALSDTLILKQNGKSIAEAFLKDLLKNEQKAKQILKTNYRPLKLLLENIADNSDREKSMLNNLNRYISAYELGKSKMYGFLGMYHCLQSSYNGGAPFAFQLKQQLGNSAAIKSIIGFYVNGQMMVPYNAMMQQVIPAQYAQMLWQANPAFAKSKKYLPVPYSNNQDSPVMQKVDKIELLEKYAESAATIFKLNGDKSPFSNSKTFGEVKGPMGVQLSNAKDHTTDAFQYLLLFKAAKAATPLD